MNHCFLKETVSRDFRFQVLPIGGHIFLNIYIDPVASKRSKKKQSVWTKGPGKNSLFEQKVQEKTVCLNKRSRKKQSVWTKSPRKNSMFEQKGQEKTVCLNKRSRKKQSVWTKSPRKNSLSEQKRSKKKQSGRTKGPRKNSLFEQKVQEKTVCVNKRSKKKQSVSIKGLGKNSLFEHFPFATLVKMIHEKKFMIHDNVPLSRVTTAAYMTNTFLTVSHNFRTVNLHFLTMTHQFRHFSDCEPSILDCDTWIHCFIFFLTSWQRWATEKKKLPLRYCLARKLFTTWTTHPVSFSVVPASCKHTEHWFLGVEGSYISQIRQ